MKILYYDCFAGISGDMNLAAMVDLGIEPAYLTGELKKLKLKDFDLLFTRDQRHGISGTRADVKLKKADDQSHRTLSDIELIIDSSDLNDNIKSQSRKIFRILAEAEARVHNKTPESVHFHEVGAIDSIVDIVGAAICFDHLKVEKVLASTVELGGGVVTGAHGKLPVPAPATAEILQGIPVSLGSASFETTTPTGAAILAAIVGEFTDQVVFEIEKTAYGIGHKQSDEIPNVLRVFLGSLEEPADSKEIIIECNIDDMNPEWYDYLMEELFNAGAKEVFYTPVIMKKSRPAVKISVLCTRDKLDEIGKVLFSNTTTLGLRSYTVEKKALERRFTKLETEFGEVTLKSSYYKGERIHTKPEYEDCKRLAKENNIPLHIIYEKIKALLEGSG
ncbi:MAG: nickel pincer cofactor biosynthesis protein LarC [Bacteroidales bacterium]|nr:MAG: nickel pincer cofactor biosynthesis protein LarC [Bacteroidales bacterium]